jgi:acetyl esterase/lipase
MKQMKLFLTGLILCLHVASASAAAPSLPDPILLWPEGAPGATGTSPEDKPAISAFLPDEKKRNGTAILVVPGGGYTIRAVDHEGVLAAQWLRDHGYAAFLLRYRLRRQLAARFPDESTKGTTYYAVTRAMQMKFMRLPKPKLKIGQELPEHYR